MNRIILTYEMTQGQGVNPKVNIFAQTEKGRMQKPPQTSQDVKFIREYAGESSKTVIDLLIEINEYFYKQTGDYAFTTSNANTPSRTLESKPDTERFGFSWGHEAYFPRCSDRKRERRKNARRIDKRNQAVHERLFPHFERFVKENKFEPYNL